MNEDMIKNQIDEVVETSPAATQEAANQPIEAPSYSTSRTGMPEEMQTAPVEQYETTPDRGIQFTPDTDEVITGGTAIPGLGYDTKFQSQDTAGDPLYFEPNFQPVVPYPMGNFEVDTVNPNKAAWSMAMATAGWDKDYIGYYRLPEPGSQSWWDFLVGGTLTNIEALPATIAKGVTGAATSVGKIAVVNAATQNAVWQGVLNKIMDKSPESDAGSLLNAIAKNYENTGANTIVDELNNLQDVVADAVSPLEQHAFETWDADVADNSFKANLGRGVSSGLVSFALAVATKNPEVAFTLLNFANVNEMRHKALDFGVSPGWAEAYSMGGAAINSVLDMFQFEALVNSASLVKQGTQEYLKNASLKGLWNGIKQHAPREIVAGAFEAGTEMIQTGIEELYNPEFRKDPTDQLAIAAISAFALKAITLPVSVRHANMEAKAVVAQKLGVKNLLDQIRAAGYLIADAEIAKGTVLPENRDAFVDDLISKAPDQIIKTLREGTKGELDKMPPEARKQMNTILNNIVQNFGKDVFSPKMFAKLDKETDTALGAIRNGISDAESEMIHGLVRGAYVLSAIANANNPNYKGFQVPTFVITKNKEGYSYYDQKKNEIGLHEGRSNTEYTNNSPSYAARLDSGFVPASRQSDKIASILHEMSHWMDSMVGEKGFGDFLEYYYNSIATAFGKDTARRLYTQSEIKNKSKGRPREYFAQTIGRMGKRAAEAFGLGKSQANRFLSYANIMMNQLGNLTGRAGEKLSQSIADFQTALQEVTKANMEHLSDLIEVYGSDNIKQALANFNKDSEGYGDFAEYLANQDMLKELFDVMDSFSDAAGLDKIKDLFDGDQKAMDNFVTMGDKLFREGYDKAVEEVRQRRAEAKKTAPKPVEAKRDLNNPLVLRDLIVSETDDSSKVHEEGVDYERSIGYRGTSDVNETPDVMKNKYSARGAGIYYTDDKGQAKFYWFKRAWDEGKINVEMEVMDKDGTQTKTFDINEDSYLYNNFKEVVEGAGPQEERRLFFDDWFDLLNDDGTVKDVYPVPVRTAIENMRDFVAEEMGIKPEDVLYMSTNIKGDFGKIIKSLLPDDEHMLNDEIKLADQSEYVRNAMEKLRPMYEDMVRKYRPDDYDWYMKAFESDGQDFVYRLANILDASREYTGNYWFIPEQMATKFLSNAGIEGIRFHDGDTLVFTPEAMDKIEEYTDRHEIEDLEEGATDYETQDWARAAMAKDSIKESFEAGKKPKKQIAADTVINGNDLTGDINLALKGLTTRLANPMNKVVKWAASSPWGWGLDRILVTLLGREAAEHLDVLGKYSAKQNIRSKYWDEFMERLKPVLGNPESTRAMMFRYKTMVNNLGFVRMKGLEVINPTNPEITSTRDITGWEAMYVYLMQQQGFGDRVQKGTTTKIDDIIATLSDDEKAFAMAMSDQLMSMYEKTFGKSKYAHYFPILDAEHELFGELSIDSLTARQNTDDTIAIADAGRIFSQYVSRWASHESGYFQTLKRVRDIFRYTGNDQFGPEYVFDAEQDAARMRASAQVADMTRQAIGNDGYHNLLNLVNSELAEPQEQIFDATRNHALTQMGNNIIKSILANKAVSFPKNVANLFMFWGGAKDQGRYWNSFAEGWGHMQDTYKYMMEHSGEIKQRWGSAGGINEYIDQRALGGSTAPVMKGVAKIFAKMEWNGDKTQNMAKFSAAMDMLGDAGLRVFMQSGDMIANVFGGYALVKDYMAQGLSEADAFKKLDRYIIEHQSSSNLAMKPLVQKQFNRSILGQLFAFTSEGVAKWASILGTFDEVKMGTATKSEAIANVVSIAISMALYSAFAAGAWDLLDDDDKVREEAEKALMNTVVDQVFGGLVAGNAMITPAISYLVGDSRISGMSVPIYNFALDGITALKKGDYDRVLFKALSAAGLPIGADNVWTSLFGASLLNDPNPDVRYAGLLMLAGFTPNRAVKRAGIKKESLEKNDEE